MFRKCLLPLLFLVLLSCGKESKLEREIAKIPVEVEIQRFDQRFARATPDSLADLMNEFPYLFPDQYPDSMWVEMLDDTLHRELHEEVLERFPNLTALRQELEGLFQHIRYYFPDEPLPTAITLVSQVDYQNQVIWADSLLLISMDTYLGEEHHFYQGMPQYVRSGFKEDYMVVDAAEAFARQKTPRPTSRSFVDEVVFYGKLLYLKDLLVPFKEDHEKIRYTPEELEWAKDNEEQIWRYFVERELLFSTDPDLTARFLRPAPFSKFYLQLDNEAPARLGRYIGWQMVRQYAERSEESLSEILQKPGEVIFKESNYKPRR